MDRYYLKRCCKESLLCNTILLCKRDFLLESNMRNAEIQEISYKVWNKYNPNDKIEAIIGKGHGANKYLIHHIDGNRNNNHISNLQKMTKKKHNKIHHSGRKLSEEAKRKIGDKARGHKRCLGRKFSDKSKKKMSISAIGNTNALGHKHTEETKRKQSKAAMGNTNGIGNSGRLGQSISRKVKKKISKGVKRYHESKRNKKYN